MESVTEHYAMHLRDASDAKAVLCVVIRGDNVIVTSYDVEGVSADQLRAGVEMLCDMLRERESLGRFPRVKQN